MSKKYEQLLEYVINDEADKADALFHDIVVETSRKIYADLLESEAEEAVEKDKDEDEDEQVEESLEEVDGSEVGDFLDDVDADEQGMSFEDSDGIDDAEGHDSMGGDDEGFELGDTTGDEMGDVADDGMGDENFGSDTGSEGMEGRVDDLESALDELKAEFEELMSSEQDEPSHDDFGGDDESDDEDFGGDDESGEEDADNDNFAADNDNDEENETPDKKTVGEGVEMIRVSDPEKSEKADNKRSIVAGRNPMQTGGAKAVNFAGGAAESGGKVSEPKSIGRKFANEVGNRKAPSLTSVAKPAKGENADNKTSPVAKR